MTITSSHLFLGLWIREIIHYDWQNKFHNYLGLTIMYILLKHMLLAVMLCY